MRLYYVSLIILGLCILKSACSSIAFSGIILKRPYPTPLKDFANNPYKTLIIKLQDFISGEKASTSSLKTKTNQLLSSCPSASTPVDFGTRYMGR